MWIVRLTLQVRFRQNQTRVMFMCSLPFLWSHHSTSTARIVRVRQILDHWPRFVRFMQYNLFGEHRPKKANSNIETRTAWDSTHAYIIWHSFSRESRIIMHRAVCLYSLPNSFITRVFRTVKKRINLEIVWFFVGRKRSETVSLIDWCIFMQCEYVFRRVHCSPTISQLRERRKIHIQNSGMPFITRRVREW